MTSRENINSAPPLEPKRLQELVQDPAALSRGLGKLADELAKDPGLRRVVERLCDTLRKGEAAQKVNKACLTPILTRSAVEAHRQLSPASMTAGRQESSLREKRLLTSFPLLTAPPERGKGSRHLSPSLFHFM